MKKENFKAHNKQIGMRQWNLQCSSYFLQAGDNWVGLWIFLPFATLRERVERR